MAFATISSLSLWPTFLEIIRCLVGVVDAMSNLLSLRLQCQKPTSHFLITDTRFPDLIEAEVWKNNDELGAAEYLEKYSTWIHHKHCDKLIFVFHVLPFHWLPA